MPAIQPIKHKWFQPAQIKLMNFWSVSFIKLNSDSLPLWIRMKLKWIQLQKSLIYLPAWNQNIITVRLHSNWLLMNAMKWIMIWGNRHGLAAINPIQPQFNSICLISLMNFDWLPEINPKWINWRQIENWMGWMDLIGAASHFRKSLPLIQT